MIKTDKISTFSRPLFSQTISIKDVRQGGCSQCTLSLPPENIRKPYGFLMFSGGRERCIGNKWVNYARLQLSIGVVSDDSVVGQIANQNIKDSLLVFLLRFI